MANLLLPHLKKQSRKEYILRAVCVCLCATALVLCIGVVALIPTYILLEAKRIDIDKQIQKPQDDTKEDVISNDVLQTVRSQVMLLKQDTSSQEIPYDIFVTLFKVKGDDPAIIFSRISFSRSNASIHVSGKATTRKDMVDFMTRVSEEDMFVPIPKEQFPFADLTSSKDIPFRFDIQMNQTTL